MNLKKICHVLKNVLITYQLVFKTYHPLKFYHPILSDISLLTSLQILVVFKFLKFASFLKLLHPWSPCLYDISRIFFQINLYEEGCDESGTFRVYHIKNSFLFIHILPRYILFARIREAILVAKK